ncbi:MAG: hypothetical protein ACN4GM_01570 [Gammaproteobacteria bacterium]
MTKKTGKLQKISSVLGILSFIFAAICMVFLILRIDEFGANNPVSASLLASTFFFIFVGFVLLVIGKTNLPSFNPDDHDSTNE